MSFVAVKQLFFYQPSDNTHKVIKVTSALVLLSSFSALCEFYYSGDYFPQSSSGGLVGALIFTNLSNIFGIVGSLIFIVIFFLVSISLTFSFSWLSIIDALGNGARYLILEVSAQFTRLLKFLLNALKSIDFSKFKAKDKPLAERSVVEAKPRELNLPKSNPAAPQPQIKSQESLNYYQKPTYLKVNQLLHLQFISLKKKM